MTDNKLTVDEYIVLIYGLTQAKFKLINDIRLLNKNNIIYQELIDYNIAIEQLIAKLSNPQTSNALIKTNPKNMENNH